MILVRQNVTNGDRFPCCSELQTLNFTRKVSTIELTYFHLMLIFFFNCQERNKNSSDFDPSFIEGSWDGLWWAFVTMTTLG